MALDTNPTLGMVAAAQGAHTLETSPASWPKCYRCSQRLGYPYPVERCELSPEYAQPAHLNGGFQMTVIVDCHGERDYGHINLKPDEVGPAMSESEKRRALGAKAAMKLGGAYAFKAAGTGRNAQLGSLVDE